MSPPSFDKVVQRILAKDSRYHPMAYAFVVQAMRQAQEQKQPDSKEARHVSGQELLDSFRQHALKIFGTAALNNLNDWGIRSCRDVGEIVFNLVEYELMAKGEHDSRADFENGYDFANAFPTPFYRSIWFVLLISISVATILTWAFLRP